MPRLSYEQYLASKRRRGSVLESETDAESITSFTTYRSNSSYSQSPPTTIISPIPQRYRPRTLSSGSLSFASLKPPGDTREARHARRRERQERSTLRGEKWDSPLRRWSRWMSTTEAAGPGVGGQRSSWSLVLGLLGVGVVKAIIGLGGYSGQGTPPMYGDLEAQRHWMEVTLHVPVRQWYRYGPEWWQLDYPPLTAYVSWICGVIGSNIEPSWFALDSSRANEDPNLITYLRATLLVLEVAVWWSAVVSWVRWEGRRNGRSQRTQITAIMTVLLQPGLGVIDNGHFQYNSVLLGLSLYTLLFLQQGRDVLACVAFSLALGFKQMGLYYAPAVGCYLLGKCFWLGGMRGIIHLIKLGIATISTFAMLYAPFLAPSAFPGDVLQVLHRMFPFARGIFEDKVANFWCASNVVIKWKNWFSIPGMARLATAATLISLLPTISILLYSHYTLSASASASAPAPSTAKPSASPSPVAALLPTAFFTSSMAFFLFSFQVHEKSVLVPLMPMTMMMALRSKGKEGWWEWSVLVNKVGMFSMFPLLERDGQTLQYFAVTALWSLMIGYDPLAIAHKPFRYFSLAVYLSMLSIHIASATLSPPARFPDLWVVLNVLLSFGVFGLAWLWATKELFMQAWAIGGLGDLGKSSSRKKFKQS